MSFGIPGLRQLPGKVLLKGIGGPAVDDEAVLITEGGNIAIWIWRNGDKSAEVSGDSDESDWVAPLFASDGTEGAWEKVLSGTGSGQGNTTTLIETSTGVWSGDAPSRTAGENPHIYVGSSDPTGTDGIDTPSNVNEGDVWIDRSA